MKQVKEDKVTNESKRECFYNIDMPSVPTLIAARQMLNKVVHGPMDQPPKIMLTSWCNNTMKVGGQQHKHNKDFIVKNLRRLFAKVHEVTIDHFGSLKD